MKRILTRSLVCLLALTMLFALCACGKDSDDDASESGSGAKSPEKIAKAYIVAQYTYNVDQMLSCFPDFCLKGMMEDFGVSGQAALKRAMMEQIGDSEKRDCTVLETKADYDYYPSDELDEFKDLVERRFDLTSKQLKKLTDLCRVTVTYELDGREKTANVMCFRYDGNWYVAD